MPRRSRSRSSAPRKSTAKGPAHSQTFDTSAIRRALGCVVALKVAGLIVLFDFTLRAQHAVDLPKALWSHGTAWLLLTLLALGLWRYGLAILPRTRIHLAVVAYALAMLVAAAFAENRYIAAFGDQTRYLGLTTTIDFLILYAAAAVAFRGGRDLWVLAAALAGSGGAALLYALVQYVGLDPVRWTDDPRGRPFATLGNPDVFGQLISLLLGVAVAVSAFARGRRATLVRLGAAAFAIVALGIGGLVATRGIALGLLAIVAALPVVLARAEGMAALRTRRAAIAGVLGAAALVAVLALTPLGARVRGTVTGSADIAGRALIFRAAFDAFRDRPILGWGPDNFGVAFPLYKPADSARVLGLNVSDDSAHDWVLQSLATTGVLGTLALLAVLGAQAVVVLARVVPRFPVAGAAIAFGSAAYWGHGLVSVGSVAVDWWPWLVLGVTVGLDRPLDERMVPLRRLQPVVAGVVLAVAVAGAGWAGLNALETDQDLRFARSAASTPAGLRAAEIVVQRDPGRADHWNELGRARFARQDWVGSARAFEQATQRAPDAANYWSNLALARLRLGATASQAALDAARRGVRADPNDPAPHVILAQVASQLGDFATAAAAYGRARELNPVGSLYYEEISLTLERLGDYQGAIAAFQHVVDEQGLTDTNRLRLAALYRAAGDLPRAVQLVRPPRLVAVDTACVPASLCLNVRFASEAALVVDPSNVASVSRSENYLLDGRILAQADIQYDPEQRLARIRLPAGFPPPLPGLRLRVLNVTNVFGQALDPDTAALPR